MLENEYEMSNALPVEGEVLSQDMGILHFQCPV